jgi:hypothetical protein
MKSIVMPVSEQLNEEKRNQLFSEVKETVASELNENQNGPKRKFTASEMWNRQRQVRSASDMMRRWNMN